MLKNLTEILVWEIQPDQIILFGSRARGENVDRSEYDLCVLKAGVTHLRDLAKRIYRLLYDLNAPVDVIVETPERFAQLKNNRHLIYKTIATEGQIIYEK
ncbi:nucleotidyltransferase domain-containing protein [candidate division KSB1 bacterium]|nr:nucleotidyltransferase domain-containing protein [candidate division KSB1 bacterium]